MTVELDFELRLSRQGAAAAPEVRIWVDADGNQQMDNSEEVRQLRRDGLVWRGCRGLASDSAVGVGFLVKIHADRGTRYRLRCWSNDGVRRALVYDEADTMHDGDHRIIGWCRA